PPPKVDARMTDRRQRQKELRAQRRAEEEKSARRKELSRRIVSAFIFGLVVVGAIVVMTMFSGRNQQATAYETLRSQPAACRGTQPPPVERMSFEAPERQTDITTALKVPATSTASGCGLLLELDTGRHAEAANSCVVMAREGFYDGIPSHRINPELLVQGGAPLADSTGGPGYVIADERPPADFTFEPGVVAMANRGARTTGSQFFVVVHE